MRRRRPNDTDRPGNGKSRAPKQLVNSGKVGKRVSDEERVQRRGYLVSALQAGMGHRDIDQRFAEEFGVSEATARDWRLVVLREWKRDHEESMPFAKSEQLERLRRKLAAENLRAPSEKHPNNKPNMKTVVQLERLIAQISGTIEPVRVQVNVDQVVSEGIMSIIAGMTGAEREQAIQEQRLIEERARMATN